MTTTRLLLTCTIIATLVLAAPGCKKKGEPATGTPGTTDTTVTDAARQLELKMGADFSLMDSTGKKVSLSDYEGSVVVLEWTNYECPFVAKYYDPANMVLLQTAQKYADRNVVWLAINSTYTATSAKNEEWRQAKKVPYAVLDDHLGTVGRMYYASHTPQVVILDKERRIVYYGAVDNDPERKMEAALRINYVDKALTEYLGGKPVTTPRTPPIGCTVKYAPASAAVEMK